jgi:hypothetical protein
LPGGANIVAAANDRALFVQDSSDNIICLAYIKANTPPLTLASGRYTPTLTNTTNVAASTAYSSHYLRVGDEVVVQGSLDIDPTAGAGAATVLGISLPIASNLGASIDLSGSAASTTATVDTNMTLSGDTANDRASLAYSATDATNHNIKFQFTYQVI